MAQAAPCDYGNGTVIYNDYDDATWVLTATFIVFTMQTGFGLLESGWITSANALNVMVKNAIDVIVGGLSYWMLGYGFSYGKDAGNFIGTDKFFLTIKKEDNYGPQYGMFFFQSSFAATSSTIVSGAVAERVNFISYMIFTFFSSLIYAVPCHWIWSGEGWLTTEFKAFDFAGSGVVHLVGAVMGLVGIFFVGSRRDRWTKSYKFPPSSPLNVILGLFFLWWGWLGFNCGSVLGIKCDLWDLAMMSAVNTIRGSIGGGIVALILSFIIKKQSFDISFISNGILGGLVGVTSFCMAIRPGEAMIVGALGGLGAIGTDLLLKLLKIDDPVGAVGVHGGAGIVSVICVGLFAEKDFTTSGLLSEDGVFRGGDGEMLGAQFLYIVALIAWAGSTSFIVMLILDLTLGMRCSRVQEVFGADLIEHHIGGRFSSKERILYDKQDNFLSYIPKSATYEEMEQIRSALFVANGTYPEVPEIKPMTINSLPEDDKEPPAMYGCINVLKLKLFNKGKSVEPV